VASFPQAVSSFDEEFPKIDLFKSDLIIPISQDSEKEIKKQ